MAETALLLGEQEGLGHVLRAVAARARDLTGADFAAISVFDDDPFLERFTYSGMNPDLARRLGDPPSGRGLLGALAEADGPLRLDDLRGHPAFSGWPEQHPEMGPFIGVPFRAGHVIGALYLTRGGDGTPFDDHDEAEATTLAMQAAGAVAHAVAAERGARIALLEERLRIAHDLHDGTIQSLYALGLTLEAISCDAEAPGATAEGVDTAVMRVKELIEDIRGYISGLESEEPISEPDLIRDLHHVARSLAPTGCETVVNVTAQAQQAFDPREIEDLVFIAREAMSNAVRHGEATKVAIDLRQGRGGCSLTIQDNGSGFDPEAVRQGMGTVSMRSRAERLGGSLTAIGIPGMGATVRVWLPDGNGCDEAPA